MKRIIQLEEALMFAACAYYYPHLGYSWGWFWALILAPDISMLGYLGGPGAGAFCYNLVHHRGVAVTIFFVGFCIVSPATMLIGYILFIHATLDRALGYGLKYEKGFKFTHLGEVGGRHTNP
jgi:hypothetical protein